MNDEEAGKLDDLKASIGRLTNTGSDFHARQKKRLDTTPTLPIGSASLSSSKMRMPADAEDMDEEDLRRYNRLMDKKDRKGFQKNQEVVAEELVPKATGRDAMIEKKKQINAYHKQERDYDVEINDSDLMGGNDNFSAA
ncbi:hypothetical protein HDU97_000824 [Phlyctochytrium planicorne]|nr:hypothetical protein HDU97_000824 [Phlyctochytrium planicorne]